MCFQVLWLKLLFWYQDWVNKCSFLVSSQGKVENQMQPPQFWMLWSISRGASRLETFCWSISFTIMGTQKWNLYEVFSYYCQFQKCGLQVSEAEPLGNPWRASSRCLQRFCCDYDVPILWKMQCCNFCGKHVSNMWLAKQGVQKIKS